MTRADIDRCTAHETPERPGTGRARRAAPGRRPTRNGARAAALLLALACAACRDDDARVVTTRADPAPSKLVRISGSDDVYPLAEILARQFEQSEPGYRVTFAPPTHSRGGAAAVTLGTADVGLMSRPMTAESERGSTTYLHLAHDIVVFAVHSGVPVKGLTREQILDIYAGRITNWSEVGGRDAPIVVLDRAEHTSIKIALRRQLFGASFAVTPSAIVLERPGDLTTSLTTLENSIGYLSLGDTVVESITADILEIDGVDPTPANFRKNLYRLTRPFGFVIGPNPTRETMRFIKFLFSEDSRRTMELHGYPPIVMDLNIAVLPEQSLLAQEQRYGPLVQYLGKQLGLQMTVKLKLLPNYGQVIEEFKTGQIDAAFLGSLALALCRAQAGVEPLVRPERDGASQYRSLIVTRKDGPIRSWKDLRGKSFGFVDKSTTAGYLYPILFFRQHGIARPEDFLGSIVYTGSHDLVFTKVARGELDAGAAKDLILAGLVKTDPALAGALRVIATSPPVPNNVFVLGVKQDFPCFHCHALVPGETSPTVRSLPRGPEGLKAILTELLLKLPESEEGRRVLAALDADRFVRTTLDDLTEVNKMIREAGFDPASYNP